MKEAIQSQTFKDAFYMDSITEPNTKVYIPPSTTTTATILTVHSALGKLDYDIIETKKLAAKIRDYICGKDSRVDAKAEIVRHNLATMLASLDDGVCDIHTCLLQILEELGVEQELPR